jgi:hypothetical protein
MAETGITDTSGQDTPNQQSASALAVTQALLRHVASIAEMSNAAAVFVYVDALGENTLPLPGNLKFKVYYITRTVNQDKEQLHKRRKFIRAPNVPLSRLGQVKVAIFLALSRGFIKAGDTVVFV